ncbi:MAG: leucyl/phenylalanyl-tRNA--protein transferase [Candidatus Solibacter usitatus]|nr:leucyl/phenylalanyl-tRNA--protein transferase [Candidatus Solibacter usitatus]
MVDIVRTSRGLDAQAVLDGYRRGEFPMGYPGRRLITWHHPAVRAILPLDALHISRSLQRKLRAGAFRISFDEDFSAVMTNCANRPSTWITPEIFRVYLQLHHLGHAHSVEVWVDGRLAGGIYGVHIGEAFFAESMFHTVTDMSKVALVKLVQRLLEQRFRLLEVQYLTSHLSQFGVIEIPDEEYRPLLVEAVSAAGEFVL